MTRALRAFQCRRLNVAAFLATALLATPVNVPAMATDPPEAVDRSALRVCADPSNLPFSNDKGEGFENKIAELLAARLNVPLKYTWYPNTVGFLRNTLRARRCDLVLGIVTGAELVQSTNPYYRSAYVMVTRTADSVAAETIDALRSHDLRIGLTAGAPPADIVAKSGLASRVRPYDLIVDTRHQSPGKDMIQNLVDNEIDVALMWGPIAGYYAALHGDVLNITPLTKESNTTRLDFYITMAVRPGENAWKNDINELLRDNAEPIQEILRNYHVPRLDSRRKLMP